MRQLTATANTGARSSTLRLLVRGLVPIVIGLVLGGLAGLLVTAVQHKSYTATSRVLVTATGVDSSAQANVRTTSAINLDTEAQLVKSAAVIQRATETYPTLTKYTFEDLVADIAVTVPPNTTVLAIAFTADTAAIARSGADALSTAYLDDRQSNAQGLLDRQKRNGQETVTALTTQLQKASHQVGDLPKDSPSRPYLQNRIGILKNQINGENQQIVTLGSVQITPGRVVTAASLPTSPSSPSRTINVASGLGVGLILGLLAAWLLLRFRRSVRRPDDVTHVVDVPCLGVLPRPGAGTAGAEPYRRLALVTSSAVPGAQRLVFATPLVSPSGSQVAVGVAAAMTRAGRSTVVLRVNAPDINGRRPRGVDIFSVPNADAVSPGESLAAGLDRVRGTNGLLIVAAGDTTRSADAQAVSTLADAVVLVVDVGTRTRDVRAAVRALDEVGAPILGIVLTRTSRVTDRSAATESDDASDELPIEAIAPGGRDTTVAPPPKATEPEPVAPPEPEPEPAAAAEPASDGESAAEGEPASRPEPATPTTARSARRQAAKKTGFGRGATRDRQSPATRAR